MSATSAPESTRTFSLIDFFVRYGVLIIFAVVLVSFWLFVPGFASGGNLISIFQAQAVAGIAALGMTLTAVIGDLDLSVGATAGLSVTVAALMMIKYNLTGTTARALVLLAVVGAGLLWAFTRNEEGLKKLGQITFGGAIALGAATLMANLGFAGATF